MNRKLITLLLILTFCLTFAVPALGARTITLPVTKPAVPTKPIIPTIPTIPTTKALPTNADMLKLLSSDTFKLGLSAALSKNLSSISAGDLKDIESVIPTELVKDLFIALILNDSTKTKVALDAIVAKLQADAPELLAEFAPVIADYAADSLANQMIMAGYPGTKADLKAKLLPIITGVLTGQTPANTDTITQKLIAAGVDAKFAPVLGYAIALMTSDEMIDIVAPVIALIIIDMIGQTIGISIPPTIKAAIAAKISPVVAKILKGIAKLSDYQSLGTMGSSLIIKK